MTSHITLCRGEDYYYLKSCLNKKKFSAYKMLTILIFTLFILAENHTQASFSNDCMDLVITDCDRNFCDSQTEPNWPSAELCQLTCQLSGDSCQSWAYSSNNQVINSEFGLNIGSNLKMLYASSQRKMNMLT